MTGLPTRGPYHMVVHPDGTWTVQNRRDGGGECVAQQYGDSSEDNGRLLAASYAMLEALRDVSLMLDTALREYEGESWARRVRAAVDDATGFQHLVYAGVDGDNVHRVSHTLHGYGDLDRDRGRRECWERVEYYIRCHPDTGPVSNWRVFDVVGAESGEVTDGQR